MVYPPNPYAEARAAEIPDFRRPDEYRALQLIAGIVAFVLAELLAGFGVGMTVFLAHGSPALTDFHSHPYAMAVGMTGGAVAMVVFYSLIMRFIARAPRHGLRGRNVITELLLGLTFGAVLVAASVGIIALFGGWRITGTVPSHTILPTLALAFALSVGPAFMEELLFRGFLLRILDAWWGWIPSLLVTSALFGVVHLTNPHATLTGAIAIGCEAGLLLGAAYLLTRRLWLAIGIHASWNFVQAFVFSSPVSGTGDFTGLFTVTWSGPEWLTGGAMGIEGSLITVIITMAAGFGLLGLAHRHRTLLPREAVIRRRERS